MRLIQNLSFILVEWTSGKNIYNLYAVIVHKIHILCMFTNCLYCLFLMSYLYIFKKVCQHEQEQAQLKERARRLERRLGTLDSEYAQQVENLRAAYHKTLSAGLERDVEGEENIRQRYQAEIEQLRVRIFVIVLYDIMCD